MSIIPSGGLPARILVAVYVVTIHCRTVVDVVWVQFRRSPHCGAASGATFISKMQFHLSALLIVRRVHLDINRGIVLLVTHDESLRSLVVVILFELDSSLSKRFCLKVNSASHMAKAYLVRSIVSSQT